MQKRSLSVSIVIPAYNEEDQLYDCLSAIENQIDFPDEVIVIDNNSTDNTANIARKFAFVTLIRETRQGLRFSRNTGIDSARGDIVGRIDADTQLAPDWVANVRSLFAADDKLIAATGPVYYHDMPLRPFTLQADHFIRNTLFSFQRYPLLYGSNMAIRRSAWADLKRRLCNDGHFFEDLDFTIHLRDQGHPLRYAPSLIAGVSARRMDDSPRDFYNNLRLYNETFAQHGQTSHAAIGARLVFLSIYPMCKLLRQFYDSRTGKLTFNKAASLLSPRPTSNT